MVRARPGSSSFTQVCITQANSMASPCARTMPFGPATLMSAALSIQLLRLHGETVERESETGIAGAPSACSERIAGRCGLQHFQPAHQHIEQFFARRLLGHVGVAAEQHLLIGVLDLRGQDRERRGKFRPQLRERDAGALGDIGQPDPLEGFAPRATPSARR